MHVRSDVLREYVLIITSSKDNCIDNADTVGIYEQTAGLQNVAQLSRCTRTR
jgi:hypothetical protein